MQGEQGVRQQEGVEADSEAGGADWGGLLTVNSYTFTIAFNPLHALQE